MGHSCLTGGDTTGLSGAAKLQTGNGAPPALNRKKPRPSGRGLSVL